MYLRDQNGLTITPALSHALILNISTTICRLCLCHHERSFDIDKINAWLNAFITIKGPDIYRMKGVIAVSGSTSNYISGSSHEFYKSTRETMGEQDVINRMVFIGKDLDEGFIRLSLEECLA